jgi:uncharacterized glyoxalase superfamily protein PhnB
VPRLLRAAPVLIVRDLVASAEYWRDAVGFELPGYWGDPPAFAVLERDGCRLMLAQGPEGFQPRPNWTVVDMIWNVYFNVDDADALHAELLGRGAKIDYEPCDQPWKMREFGIQDLDGNDIAFGTPMEGR